MTEKLSKWLGTHLRELVIGGVAAGFAMVMLELLMMHHDEGKQLVAIAATGVGAVLALAGVKAQGKVRTALAAGLLAVAFTGVVGTYFHLAGGEDEEEHAAVTRLARWADGQTAAHAEEAEEDEHGEKGEKGERGEKGKDEEHRPPLAPLSVSGLGVLGALGVLARRQD